MRIDSPNQQRDIDWSSLFATAVVAQVSHSGLLTVSLERAVVNSTLHELKFESRRHSFDSGTSQNGNTALRVHVDVSAIRLLAENLRTTGQINLRCV